MASIWSADTSTFGIEIFIVTKTNRNVLAEDNTV